MKTFFFSVLFAMSVIKGNTQVNFMIQAGVLSSKYKIDQLPYPIYNAKSDIGAKIGVAVDIPVSGTKLHFAPEFNFILKGYYYEDTTRLYITNSQFNRYRSNIFYAEVPLIFTYKLHSKPDGLFFGIGPVIGFGLGGKAKKDFTIQNSTLGINIIKQKVLIDNKENSSGDDNVHFKQIEVGAKILIGYALPGGVRLNGEYRPNFSDVSAAANTSFKNRYWGFTMQFPITPKK
jgi:Outer membrane protein beta-barrel domain